MLLGVDSSLSNVEMKGMLQCEQADVQENVG